MKRRQFIKTAAASSLATTAALSSSTANAGKKIKWKNSLETMLEYGCDTVLELGPGNVLSKMLYSHRKLS